MAATGALAKLPKSSLSIGALVLTALVDNAAEEMGAGTLEAGADSGVVVEAGRGELKLVNSVKSSAEACGAGGGAVAAGMAAVAMLGIAVLALGMGGREEEREKPLKLEKSADAVCIAPGGAVPMLDARGRELLDIAVADD